MENIKPTEDFYFEKYGINVHPYLTINEQKLIVDLILAEESVIQREQILIANVLVCCTDIEKLQSQRNEQEDPLLYEDLLYSGFWDELLEACPYIKQGIDVILKEVERKESLSVALVEMLNKIAPALEGVADELGDKMNSEDIESLKDNITEFLAQHKTESEVNTDDSKQ